MKIAIIGIGSLASLFAARLAPLAEVVMVGRWAEQVQAIKAQGVTLVGLDGQVGVQKVGVIGDPAGQPATADLALILVKSYQTERAAQLAQQLLAPHGVALTLQNGLGNLEKIARVVGVNRAFLGTTSEGARVIRPGVVQHTGRGETYVAGDEMGWVVEVLVPAGFTTHHTHNVNSLIWGKLAINTAINPLTALLRVPNGYLATHPIARYLMTHTAAETAAIAHAQGISLPYPNARQRALQVAQATAPNHSSMLQDILNNRPTEIDAICGAVVRAGQQHAHPTPLNNHLLRLMQTYTTFL